MSAALIRAAIEAAEEYEELDSKLSKLPRNDLGNAKRLIQRFGGQLIHVQNLGWHWWTGKYWSREDGDREVQRCAHATARALRAELRAIIDLGPRSPDRDGVEELETAAQFGDRCETFARWVRSSGDVQRLAGMIKTAIPDLHIARHRLDADPFLFNLENGTLMLRDETAGGVGLKPHDPGDYITRLAPVKYDREAQCRKFLDYLAKFLPDAKPAAGEPAIQPFDQRRAFVQRAAGYSLTGDIGEQCAFLCYGEGANGKSTLMLVFRGVMGGYASGMPVETILEASNNDAGKARPDLAELPGTRCAITSEPPLGSRLNSNFIKGSTGGEPIKARGLHKDYFEFNPRFKMWISFNELPPVRAQDHGMWRRLVLLEFGVTIPKDEQIKHYERVLLEEASGILNWMLDGFRVWRERGLCVPALMEADATEYRELFDPISGFLKDCTEQKSGAKTPASDMRASYVFYCKKTDAEPVHSNSFGRALKARKIKRMRSNGVYYLDISIKQEWVQQPRMETG